MMRPRRSGILGDLDDLLREARDKGVTRHDIARKAGVSTHWLDSVANRRITNPGVDGVEKTIAAIRELTA